MVLQMCTDKVARIRIFTCGEARRSIGGTFSLLLDIFSAVDPKTTKLAG